MSKNRSKINGGVFRRSSISVTSIGQKRYCTLLQKSIAKSWFVDYLMTLVTLQQCQLLDSIYSSEYQNESHFDEQNSSCSFYNPFYVTFYITKSSKSYSCLLFMVKHEIRPISRFKHFACGWSAFTSRSFSRLVI